MTSALRSIFYLGFIGALMLGSIPAHAADADEDALQLSSAPVEDTKGAPKTKFFVEAAYGIADRRDASGTHDRARLSLDFTHTATITPDWRAVFSDRLDYIHPRDLGTDAAVNSLREAYVSWQQDTGRMLVDVGRVNLRYGPGYGYNPTDYFRDGALRAVTNIDPFSLRENRLGTVVVRGQRLGSDGSVSIAYSPKLQSQPSNSGWSVDLGATNNRNRGLVVFSGKVSDRISGQALLYKDSNLPTQLGASLTALLTDAMVAHAEFSRGQEPDLLSRALNLSEPQSTRNRVAAGLTYTTASKLSLTAEYEYNGFALSPADFDALGRNAPLVQAAYMLTAFQRQDLASREAYLIYATQNSIGLKNLDLTALLRVNAGDRSRLAWIELRHHWSNVDLALRLQQQWGRDGSEYGLTPDRRSAQMVANYYF